MKTNPDETILTTKQARQGRSDGHVRTILIVSIMLMVLAGLGFAIWYL